jgi:predicted lipid-binding transport protein (Tim44 family)
MYDKGPRTSNLAECLEAWKPYLVTTYGRGLDFFETIVYKVIRSPTKAEIRRKVEAMPDEAFIFEVNGTADGDEESSYDGSETASAVSTVQAGVAAAGDAAAGVGAAAVVDPLVLRSQMLEAARKDHAREMYKRAMNNWSRLDADRIEALLPKVYWWLYGMCDE